jgi:hypothetical protein
MSKALLLWLALGLATCAVPAHPPRQTLGELPARFVTLPLELGNGDEVTVHGEGTIYVTHFTLFFRTFCDSLVEVWRTVCGPHRCLPHPWRIFVLEKDRYTALVGYTESAPQRDRARAAVPIILHAYRLGEPVEAVVNTSKRAALEVATALYAKRHVPAREPDGVLGPQ